MNKKTLVVFSLGMLVMVGNIFAASLASCNGLVDTQWKDRADKVFGKVMLRFNYMSGNPNSNGNLIHYTVQYTMNGGDHYLDGATTIYTQCENQPNGAAYIKLGFEDGVSYLILQGSDDNTFNVVSGSKLNNGTGGTTELKGSFTRM